MTSSLVRFWSHQIHLIDRLKSNQDVLCLSSLSLWTCLPLQKSPAFFQDEESIKLIEGNKKESDVRKDDEKWWWLRDRKSWESFLEEEKMVPKIWRKVEMMIRHAINDRSNNKSWNLLENNVSHPGFTLWRKHQQQEQTWPDVTIKADTRVRKTDWNREEENKMIVCSNGSCLGNERERETFRLYFLIKCRWIPSPSSSSCACICLSCFVACVWDFWRKSSTQKLPSTQWENCVCLLVSHEKVRGSCKRSCVEEDSSQNTRFSFITCVYSIFFLRRLISFKTFLKLVSNDFEALLLQEWGRTKAWSVWKLFEMKE